MKKGILYFLILFISPVVNATSGSPCCYYQVSDIGRGLLEGSIAGSIIQHRKLDKQLEEQQIENMKLQNQLLQQQITQNQIKKQ